MRGRGEIFLTQLNVSDERRKKCLYMFIIEGDDLNSDDLIHMKINDGEIGERSTNVIMERGSMV